MGLQAIGPDGAIGEARYPPDLGFEPWCLEYTQLSSGDTYTSCNVPFAPRQISMMAANLAWVVGVSADYRFAVHDVDGNILEVETALARVAVSSDEADYYRRRTLYDMGRRQAGWRWNGPEIPAYKPAFTGILGARDGGVWLVREGPSRRVAGECTEDFTDSSTPRASFVSCWESDSFLDAFDAEGRYLGEVQVPVGLSTRTELYIRGDVVVGAASDATGTYMVKRYRLEAPSTVDGT